MRYSDVNSLDSVNSLYASDIYSLNLFNFIDHLRFNYYLLYIYSLQIINSLDFFLILQII